MKKVKKLYIVLAIVFVVLVLGLIIFRVSTTKTTTEYVKLTYTSNYSLYDKYGDAVTNVSNDYQPSLFSSSSSSSSSYDSYSTESYDYSYNTTESSDDSSNLTDGKKLKKTYDMNVETTEYDNFTKYFTEQIDNLGGYIESQYTDSRTKQDSSKLHSYTVRYADYTVRVPATKIDDLLTFVDNGSYITSNREYVEDVTSDYMDLETHIASLKAEETRLNELLEMAQTVTELIQVQDRLSEINYEIQSYETSLDTMKTDVDYCKLTLTVYEVIYYQDTVTRYTSDLSESWGDIFDEWIEDVLPVILLLTVSLIPIIALIGFAVYVVSKIVVKNKVRTPQTVLLRYDGYYEDYNEAERNDEKPTEDSEKSNE
jgi:hypothetical protein